jgi:hypothetical protein
MTMYTMLIPTKTNQQQHTSTEPLLPNRPNTHKPYKNTCGSDSGSSRTSAGKFSKLYTLTRWRKIRSHQLKIEPLCRICISNGIITPATICDHIEPHRGDMIKFWNGPFQSLCKQCHDSHKQKFEKSGSGYRKIGIDGYPVE